MNPRPSHNGHVGNVTASLHKGGFVMNKLLAGAATAAIAPKGYLAQRGLIPADDATRTKTVQLASALPPSPAPAPKKS